MSLEALLIVLMMGIEVFRPLRELRILLHDGMLGQSAAEKIFEILGAEPLIRDEAPKDGDTVALNSRPRSPSRTCVSPIPAPGSPPTRA